MEDEVGVDTSSGLETFSSYFCDAILAKPSLEKDSTLFPENITSRICGIRLSYNLGGTNLEGVLKVCDFTSFFFALTFPSSLSYNLILI
jgi:hypothetical protein